MVLWYWSPRAPVYSESAELQKPDELCGCSWVSLGCRITLTFVLNTLSAGKIIGSVFPNRLPMGWNKCNFAGVQGWHCTQCLWEVCCSRSRQADGFLGGQAAGAKPVWNGEGVQWCSLTHYEVSENSLSPSTLDAPGHKQSSQHLTSEAPPVPCVSGEKDSPRPPLLEVVVV